MSAACLERVYIKNVYNTHYFLTYFMHTTMVVSEYEGDGMLLNHRFFISSCRVPSDCSGVQIVLDCSHSFENVYSRNKVRGRSCTLTPTIGRTEGPWLRVRNHPNPYCV